MEEKKAILFRNVGALLEEDQEEQETHWGILLENNTILCLCCGGIVEPEDYEIISICDIHRIDEILMENM